jgi:hypothetical protein
VAGDLGELPRAQRRQLCQILFTEMGARVIEFNSPAGYDELVLETPLLWRARHVRVRIATRPVVQRDVERLAARMAQAGDADGLLIAPLGIADDAVVPATMRLITADELIARIERSPSIAWVDGRPAPAYERADALRALEREAAFVDPVGFRWLPVLALNECPRELLATSASPQDLFERVAFRVLTQTFRFGGKRYGEAARGKRLADSVITWTAGGTGRAAALLDCKAAASGYTMEADHVLRFERYVTDARERLAEADIDLRFIVVLSSLFSGAAGRRHPFHGRARELRERASVALAYVRAIDLARLAVRVEAAEVEPAVREAVDWTDVFSRGLVTADDLEAGMIGFG